MSSSELPSTVRAFIATRLNDSVRARIRKEQERLAALLKKDSVRWTPFEQLHLTLKFLGNVSAGDVNEISAALSQAVAGLRPFDLSVAGLGCFPSWRRPSVIWVGLEGDLQSLSALQNRLEQATGPFARPAEERAFHPHLTIGRLPRSGVNAPAVGRTLASAEVESLGSWPVTAVTFFQSQLSSRGSTYLELANVTLS